MRPALSQKRWQPRSIRRLVSLAIETAKVFEPLLQPARYKAAWGGRGSGKSHFFAGLLIEDSLLNRGMLSVCVREIQKSLKDSAKRLIEADRLITTIVGKPVAAKSKAAPG